MGTTVAPRTTIADALFSRTQQRVLGILFGAPERSFFASEIFERAGSGRGTVQRELKRLLASGLVTVRQVGNQKHYQANGASPVFHELRSLVLKTTALADPIKAALRPLQRKIELALIYGSVARGEETAGSDVDLLVVADHLLLEDLLTALETAEREVVCGARGRAHDSPDAVHSYRIQEPPQKQRVRAKGPRRSCDSAHRKRRCRIRNSITTTRAPTQRTTTPGRARTRTLNSASSHH